MTPSNDTLPSLEYLRERLKYNPETGEFTWAKRPGKGYRGGKTAGWVDDWGYVRIEIDGVAYRAHRLAWLYMTGEWPPVEVDHKSGEPGDNRWGNLRLATREQNSHNTGLRVDNTSGVKGVSRHPQYDKWVARVRTNGRRAYLGVFDTVDEAAQAVRTYREVAHGEFCRHE